MAYVIYLICVGMNSVLMHHLDMSIIQWEYWASLTLMVIAYICGTENKSRYNK